MADDNDDTWLYGESEEGEKQSVVDEAAPGTTTAVLIKTEHQENESAPTTEITGQKEENGNRKDKGADFKLQPAVIRPPKPGSEQEAQTEPAEEETGADLENGEFNDSKEKESDDEDEDDDDDNINVTIGDLRTTPGYGAGLHLKRGNLLQLSKQPGKFAVEDFESVGTINGVAAHEFNLDNLEDKPWRKPGADITDYFNYGFNEDTWKAYCERQRRIRMNESGGGLIPMATQNMNIRQMPPQIRQIIPEPMVMPPPMVGPPMGMPMSRGPPNDGMQKENTIQVMTADRREYSRKNFQDMSVPPPMMVPSPYQAMPPAPPMQPPQFGNPYGPPPDYYGGNMDPYYHQPVFEPVQESQWAGPDWGPPSGIDLKNIIPVSSNGHSAMSNGPPQSNNIDVSTVKIKTEPDDRDPYDRDRIKERSRDRSRDYERERERDRHRERSHRRRSRSRSHERRSRKHRSHSRSPSHHRSHKKKKSKKSDRHSKEGSTE